MTDTIDANIIDAAANGLMTVRMTSTAISFVLSDREARERLAQLDGVDAKAYKSVTKALLPPGYDGELKAAHAALNAARRKFYETTMAYSQAADGRAAEDRAVTVEQLVSNPSWLATMAMHGKEVKAAADTLAAALPDLMEQIRVDPDYSARFDERLYPSPQEVRDGFKFQIHGPNPIGRFEYLPISGEMGKYLARRHEKQVRAALKFGQQQTAKELAERVGNLAGMLQELLAHNDGTRDAKRAPRISPTLTENVKATVAKVRTFAQPSTEEGAALLAVADKVEALVPPERTAEQLKASMPLARSTAQGAASLVADIESLDVLF